MAGKIFIKLPDSIKPLLRRNAVEVRNANFGRDADSLVEKVRDALKSPRSGMGQSSFMASAAAWLMVPGRWRMVAGGAAALLLVGGIWLYQMGAPVWVAWTPKAEQPDAPSADKAKAAADAEAQRKVEEAERQRLAGAKADEERKAKAAAEAEARAKAEQAERERVAVAKAEEERKAKAAADAEAQRKADEAEQQRLAGAKADEERKAKAAAEAEAKRKAAEAQQQRFKAEEERKPKAADEAEAQRKAAAEPDANLHGDRGGQAAKVREGKTKVPAAWEPPPPGAGRKGSGSGQAGGGGGGSPAGGGGQGGGGGGGGPAAVQEKFLPQFPWPPPRASASYVLPDSLLQNHVSVGEVVAAIILALERNGYVERSFFQTGADGVALVTRLERIKDDGSAFADPERWPSFTPGRYDIGPSALFRFLSGLFVVDPGHYRIIVFILQTHPFSQSLERITAPKALEWLSSGANVLPPQIAKRPFSGAHCTVLIYEFSSDGSQVRVIESRLTGKDHLTKAGVLSFLEKPN